MTILCVCKGLSDTLAHAAQDAHHPDTREDLYALTLAHKIATKSGPVTGREDWNGEEDVCGSCRAEFQKIVDADPAARPVIRIVPAAADATNARSFP